MSRKQQKDFLDSARPSRAQVQRYGEAGIFLAQFSAADDGNGGFVWKSVPKSVLPALDAETEALRTELGLEPGDWVGFGSGSWWNVCTALGKLRTQVGSAELDHHHHHHSLDGQGSDRSRKPTAENLKFLWVVDFPLFEATAETPSSSDNLGSGAVEGIGSAHHPFTAASLQDEQKFLELLPLLQESGEEGSTAAASELRQNLLRIRAQHYDLVCNGWELGGGSVRIHSPDIQEAVLELLQVSRHRDPLERKAAVQASFGHVLEMLRYGCPPHAGIALGLDRLVSLLAGALDGGKDPYPLRDVIAFPKSVDGNDPCTGAPAELTGNQLRQYGFLK